MFRINYRWLSGILKDAPRVYPRGNGSFLYFTLYHVVSVRRDNAEVKIVEEHSVRWYGSTQAVAKMLERLTAGAPVLVQGRHDVSTGSNGDKNSGDSGKDQSEHKRIKHLLVATEISFDQAPVTLDEINTIKAHESGDVPSQASGYASVTDVHAF